MEIVREQLILRPQGVTWSSITDPQVLKACIQDCESMDKVADNEYEMVMSAKVGPVSAKFKGKITLADVDAPNGQTLIFEGQGAVAGFAMGQANVRLLPEGEATRLQYTAKATIGDKLAQVGSRAVDGVAKKLAENFFTKFNEHVSGTTD